MRILGEVLKCHSECQEGRRTYGKGQDVNR